MWSGAVWLTCLGILGGLPAASSAGSYLKLVLALAPCCGGERGCRLHISGGVG